jgi:catechol 2,3-dioxygenase-like lactoylglutathione lyase family enzyme
VRPGAPMGPLILGGSQKWLCQAARMATAQPSGPPGAQGITPVILGIRQIKIPVTDLTQSVRWYTKLLGLRLHREFVEQGTVAGAVMSHPGGFVLSVRVRDRVPGHPTFAGFDLFSLGVSSRVDLEALMVAANGLGSEHSGIVDRGVDGYHLDIADPDGTMIRFLAPADTDSAMQTDVDAEGFVGVELDDQNAPTFYSTSRIALS